MKPVKFVHIADLHLGKRQYNLYERYNDYFLFISVKDNITFTRGITIIFARSNGY